MGSALQPPFLRQSVAVAGSGKMSPGRLRALGRAYFVVAAVIAIGGLLIALNARGFVLRVSGALDVVLGLIFVVNGIQALRVARGQVVRTSGG
jgi:hypothetical protein